MARPSEPRPCRDSACGIRIILARRALSERWGAYEAADMPPFSQESSGCHVLVAGQAWKPADLIEDFQVRFEVSEERARELVAGYPFHRPHHHEPAETPGNNTDKEHQPA